MNREIHVRFRESLGVQSPGLLDPCPLSWRRAEGISHLGPQVERASATWFCWTSITVRGALGTLVIR